MRPRAIAGFGVLFLAGRSYRSPWTVKPASYRLANPQICIQRSYLDQPYLADVDAYEATVSQKTSNVLDTVTGEFCRSLDRDVLFQHDSRGINLGAKRKHPDLSPIRRAVPPVCHAVQSAPSKGTAQAEAALLPVSAVRDVAVGTPPTGAQAPLAGLEPATYGLEVRRSIL